MISFKNNQNVPPLFDYYLETDLDSFDDQPVDYSKRYADQDSYEDCRRRKSVLKTNEFPAEVSQTIKQSCNDEVKVYCIEGTPLTISSASSFCDLREVGTSNAGEKSNTKCTFSPISDGESPGSFEVDTKKNIESPDDKKEETSPSKEKEDTKEGKSVSFRNSNDISKASSPLMFSRSSSVASLNSFEQQSIVDDRSSVSVFSALTSGLISPSDLPDSPGEVMSPALTDKASSPKIDVTKIDCNSECDNIVFSEKNQIDLEESVDNDTDNLISTHAQLSKTKEYVPADSYKSETNSEEDNEMLVEHLEVSNDSLDIDEVFDNPDYETNSFALQNEEDLSKNLSKSDDESDGEDDILLQQCIQLGMSNNSVENKSDMNVHKKMDYQPHSQSASTTQEIFTSNVEMKEVALLEKNVLQSDEKEIVLKYNKEVGVSKEFSEVNDVSMEEVELTLVAIKSVDDSDEDDEMLQRCIQLGMPESTPNRTVKSTEGYVKTLYLPHPTNYSTGKDLYSPPCAKSDDDSEGDDDILLQQCIQLGMPDKLPEDKASGHMYKRMENHNVLLKTNASQVQVNDEGKSIEPLHSNRNIVMPLPCMQYRMPYKLNGKADVHTKPIGVGKYTSPVAENMPRNVPRKMYPMKIDADSDGDEADILLQHCIEMGMPKESYEKKRLDPGVFRKPEYNPCTMDYHSTNDLRDDCPDGISDGDEEDDLLAKCIRAGMPSPNISNDIQNRLYASQTGSTSRKLQLPNRPFLPDTNTELNKKIIHPRLPQNLPYAPIHSSTAWLSSTSFIDVDSMMIYRTEDTPILSPSASISDLSSLSFNESFLNNSRNSDCSSESDDDDELLLRCIRSGMPEAKRAVA